MNDLVIKADKMKKLQPSKIVFVIPELIGIGTFMVAFVGYLTVLVFISSCTSESNLGPSVITVDNPHYGKSRKPNNLPYQVSRSRNTGGPHKYHGYQIK